jgi:hypothetical protein
MSASCAAKALRAAAGLVVVLGLIALSLLAGNNSGQTPRTAGAASPPHLILNSPPPLIRAEVTSPSAAVWTLVPQAKHAEEPKPEEPKPAETKAGGDPKPEEPKPEEPKPAGTKPGEEPKPAETKPGEEPKPVETKPPERVVPVEGTPAQDPNFIVIPIYISVTNVMVHTVRAADLISRFQWRVPSNLVTKEREGAVLRGELYIVDNTACATGPANPRQSTKEFELHEHMRSDFDCAAWLSFVDRVGKGELPYVHVVPQLLPLNFGASQNFFRRHCLFVLKQPRFIWMHSDAVIQHDGPLRRSLFFAAALTDPFCVLYTHYDIIAVFDAATLHTNVGDWDQVLWYYGDNDYYSRCDRARVMIGEIHGDGVGHEFSSTVNKLSGIAKDRFSISRETMKHHFDRREQWRGGTPFNTRPQVDIPGVRVRIGAPLDSRKRIEDALSSLVSTRLVTHRMHLYSFPMTAAEDEKINASVRFQLIRRVKKAPVLKEKWEKLSTIKDLSTVVPDLAGADPISVIFE